MIGGKSAGPGQGEPSGNLSVLLSLFPYLWPQGEWVLRLRVVLALACILAAKGAIVTVPLFLGEAVDALSVEQPSLLAIPIGLIIAYSVARLASLAFNQLRDALFERVTQRALRRVALNVFQHMHALSLRFHLSRQTGALSRSIERGTTSIQQLLGIALFNLVPTLIEFGLVVAILWGKFDWTFSAVTFVTVAGYIAFTMLTTEWRIKFRRQMNEADNAANQKAIDSLLNYETVKYFGNEAHEQRRYDSALKGYEEAAVTSQSSLSLMNTGQALIVSLGLGVMMWLAARGIVTGSMRPGDFVVVNTFLIQLAQPLNMFGWVYRSVKQALVDMERMFELLKVEEEVRDVPGAPQLAVSAGRIQFEDVSFAYDPRRPILQGVRFTVEPGTTTAIVGPTGAGKSTIARLLFRFYDPTEGRILIDGQDIRSVEQLSLRAAIGIVPQDTVLFNDTLGYNIGYAKPSAGPVEIAEAARMAHIERFVAETPDGYDTLVGERGLKLSGGEKQRVAIARVFLKAPPILILDEATSALDTATERDIQSNLREVAAGRTTLVIAHRLSTVIEADEILVLDQGRVAERGTHQALLGQGGRYAAMWAAQLDDPNADPADLAAPVEPARLVT